jgi:hypothetical protein
MPPLEPIVPRDSGLRRSFCQPRDYCGIVQREFRWLGYDEDNRNHTYLRITFADSSRLDLALPPKPTQTAP